MFVVANVWSTPAVCRHNAITADGTMEHTSSLQAQRYYSRRHYGAHHQSAGTTLLQQTARRVNMEFKILSANDSRIENEASGIFTSLYKNYSRFATAVSKIEFARHQMRTKTP